MEGGRYKGRQPIELRRGQEKILHIDLFGACSAFTRVAARTLARSPICDQLHRRLQPFRHLHDCSGCFRLERLAGRGLHPLESAALSRRTRKPDVRGLAGERLVRADSSPSETAPEAKTFPRIEAAFARIGTAHSSGIPALRRPSYTRSFDSTRA